MKRTPSFVIQQLALFTDALSKHVSSVSLTSVIRIAERSVAFEKLKVADPGRALSDDTDRHRSGLSELICH